MPSRTSALTRRLVLAGVLGPVLFIAVFTLAGLLRAGYEPADQTVSELALGSGGWIQTTSFLVTGAAMIAFAIGLHRALPPRRRGRLGPVLVGIAGAGIVLSGVFATDPTGAVETTGHGAAHNGAFVIVMLSLVGACFALSGRVAAGTGRPGRARALRLTGVATLALLVLFVGTPLPGEGDGLLSYGVAQRVLLVVAFGWLSVVALWVMPAPAVARGASAPVTRTP
jgi:Protein of unknown function (DUF998)